MRRLIPLIAIAAIAASCGADAAPDTAPGTQAPTTQAPTTEAPTTQAPTTEVPPTEEPGEFAIAEVVFGSGGGVAIRNVGDHAATLAGLAVCQRPSYFNLPDIALEPGDVIWLVPGDPQNLSFDPGDSPVERATFGSLRAASGEIGLYSRPSFGSSDAILSYVEWGPAGHGRSSVAIGAGIWPDGGSVAISEDTSRIVSTSDLPVVPEDWSLEG